MKWIRLLYSLEWRKILEETPFAFLWAWVTYLFYGVLQNLLYGVLFSSFFVFFVFMTWKKRDEVMRVLRGLEPKEEEWEITSLSKYIWEENTCSRDILIRGGFTRSEADEVLQTLEKEGFFVRSTNNKRILAPDVTEATLEWAFENAHQKPLKIVRYSTPPPEFEENTAILQTSI